LEKTGISTFALKVCFYGLKPSNFTRRWQNSYATGCSLAFSCKEKAKGHPKEANSKKQRFFI
jgi:hypothetical protein